MKKILSVILVVVMSAVSFAACSGGAAPSAAPAPAPAPAPAQPEAPAEEAPAGETAPEGKTYPTLHFSAGGVYDLHSALTVGYLKFGELLEERSGGTITCEYFPNSQLGSDLECAEMVSNGTLETSIGTTINLANFSPEIGVLDLPFLIQDRATAYAAFDSEMFRKDIYDTLLPSNIYVLGIMDQGFRLLTNDGAAITSIDDLNGFKVRVQENQLHQDMWTALGAYPTPMAFGEVFTALEQGTIDGQENPLVAIRDTALYEIQKNIYYTNHVFSPGYIIINKQLFEGLDADTRELITTCAKDAIDHQRNYVQSEEASIVSQMEAAGVTFHEISDISVWAEKARTIYPKYAVNYKQEWIDALSA